MATVKEIYSFINKLAPFENQDDWDNSGLLIGDMDRVISKAAVCLDITKDTTERAKKLNVDLLISHHPVIFAPLREVLYGSVAYDVISSGISVICAHTNWDAATDGVNDILAKLIGLDEVKTLDITGNIVRVGISNAGTPLQLAKCVAKKLGTTVRLADAGNSIRTVAVCGGSGSSLVCDMVIAGVDAFVTGEVKYSDFIFAKDHGMSLITAGHCETETPSMPVLAKFIKDEFLDIEVTFLDSFPTTLVNDEN